MQIAIIQFPGSNCERETMLAVKRAGMQPIEFLWNEPHEKLAEMDGYIIVGGFSYEDRSRAGIIAALDPIMLALKAQSERGKPILGICNGAQILVEAGLVPGVENNKIALVLTDNKRIRDGKILGTGFYNAWVNIRLAKDYQRNAFTRCLTAQTILHIPAAHAEGRFVMSKALLEEIKVQGLNVFQYCDEAGQIISDFPVNPNGSIDNLAALANKAGNVMAMMPHPERSKNGDAIFQSMREYILEGKTETALPLYYYPRRNVLQPFPRKKDHYECRVKLIITDNQALTVQNRLQQQGIDVAVKREVHWEIACDSPLTLEAIKKSGVLFNDRKEIATICSSTSANEQQEKGKVTFLVRAKDDLLGQQKQQLLHDHYAINGIKHLHHGVLWHFTAETAKMDGLIEQILQTHIIFNPYAHDYYRYA